MIDITQEEIMKNWNVDNTDEPLVSIRCITYNHEPYIAQALDGFLMQKTTFSFEVIVHDDASTDKTADIIREYEKKFPKIIKPIYETENQWSKHDGSLRRIMDSACYGKYIAYCEGDDYWIDENKLQMQVEFLEKNKDFVLCCHNANIYDENKHEFIESDNGTTKIPSVSDIYVLAKEGNYIFTQSVVIEKDKKKLVEEQLKSSLPYLLLSLSCLNS